MVFFKKGRLDFLIRYQDFPLLVGHFGEAAAVDDREILADETALLMGRQGENLEAQLLGDEEDRTEDVVDRRLAKRIVGDDDTRIVFSPAQVAALFRSSELPLL